MNKRNLQTIFQKYIDNFEYINKKEHDENYKWEIAYQFQSFDVEADNFAEMLAGKWKLSANLIDSAQQLPFYALVDYAKKEPETVREMFRKLFADEKVDVHTKQSLIQEFIDSSEMLRQKYYPDSRLYVNNQRSVMQYLFLRYPESNYGYKASQAKSFADCIEFYDDWGPMTDFRLDVYYRMCDILVEEIKAHEALIQTHKSRYENSSRTYHPDNNLHILALDIIYSSQVYDFYDGMSFAPINAHARKLYLERVAKAKQLELAVQKAYDDNVLLTEAYEYFINSLTPGVEVIHRTFGEGIIESCNGSAITITFPKVGGSKKLGLFVSLLNGLLTCYTSDFEEKLNLYKAVMSREQQIPQRLKSATEELQPYLEYLD